MPKPSVKININLTKVCASFDAHPQGVRQCKDNNNFINDKDMKDEILICDCSSVEHQMVLRFDDDKDLGQMVYVEIHLVPLVWHKRLWQGIKYIFGYKCCYGNFEEMILSPKHARQIYGLYKFLRPKLTKEELTELANCNGQAVEIGIKED